MAVTPQPGIVSERTVQMKRVPSGSDLVAAALQPRKVSCKASVVSSAAMLIGSTANFVSSSSAIVVSQKGDPVSVLGAVASLMGSTATLVSTAIDMSRDSADYGNVGDDGDNAEDDRTAILINDKPADEFPPVEPRPEPLHFVDDFGVLQLANQDVQFVGQRADRVVQLPDG